MIDHRELFRCERQKRALKEDGKKNDEEGDMEDDVIHRRLRISDDGKDDGRGAAKACKGDQSACGSGRFERGKDYENFRKYLFADYFLFIRGKVQPKPYNDKELEFKITSMVQLQEMRDTMIKEMVVLLPVEDVTEMLIRDLTAKVCESKGDTLLRLSVYDREAQVSLRLFSKSHKVSLTQSLVGYLEDNNINYSIA